jgi:hypothetical protein
MDAADEVLLFETVPAEAAVLASEALEDVLAVAVLDVFPLDFFPITPVMARTQTTRTATSTINVTVRMISAFLLLRALRILFSSLIFCCLSKSSF